MTLRVYAWHLADPGGACAAIRTIVAAADRTAATAAVRAAGLHPRRRDRVEADAEEAAAALAEPGVVLRREWGPARPYRWRRPGRP